jgi:uncharacterized protein
MAGKVVHIEIKASDPDRASGFYNNVLGWSFGASAMPDFDYRMTQLSDEQGAAVYQAEDAGSGLVVYFDTDEIDATIAKVREHGGEADDKQPIPQIGWFAACRDLDGNQFSLFQSDESAQPG